MPDELISHGHYYRWIIEGQYMDIGCSDPVDEFHSTTFSAIYGRVRRHLESLAVGPAEAWEIVSHDFLLVGNHVIGTFLVRRPKG